MDASMVELESSKQYCLNKPGHIEVEHYLNAWYIKISLLVQTRDNWKGLEIELGLI